MPPLPGIIQRLLEVVLFSLCYCPQRILCSCYSESTVSRRGGGLSPSRKSAGSRQLNLQVGAAAQMREGGTYHQAKNVLAPRFQHGVQNRYGTTGSGGFLPCAEMRSTSASLLCRSLISSSANGLAEGWGSLLSCLFHGGFLVFVLGSCCNL